jgi:D-3-phosphoglycerate dehydrogenase / 2-oxoglutarate reductase
VNVRGTASRGGLTDSAFRVIQTDWGAADSLVEDAVFDASGLVVDFEMKELRTEAEVIDQCAEADALIVAYAPVTRRVLECLPKCRCVSFEATGFNSVDMAAATHLGLVVTNVAGYCTPEVADHALGLLLALSRNLLELDASVKHGGWDYKACGLPERLSTQTLGIIGLGRIGSQVALRAQAFGLDVMACDPYVDEAYMAGLGVRKVELQQAVGADYVSVHCLLTPETHHLIDAAVLGLMKPTAYLINTARGGCVDTDALAAALQDGRVAGAGLDVLDPEPAPTGHPIYSLPNVILTPHAAFYSRTAEEEGRRRCCEEVASVLRGEVPRHVCNPEVLSSPSLRLLWGRPAGATVEGAT